MFSTKQATTPTSGQRPRLSSRGGRSLPAEAVALVEVVLGNTVISQYLAHRSNLTVMEELQAMRDQAA